MKCFTIAATLLMGTLASALPTTLTDRQASPPSATISFSNDQSGANFPVTANLNYAPVYLSGVATSMQLTNGIANNPACTVSNVATGSVLGTLTAQQTFVRFGGQDTPLQPVNLAGYQVSCGPLRT